MPIMNVDLGELSGIDPGTANLSKARIDFSPYAPYANDDEWVSRNILRISCPEGVATTFVPATPTGNAYEVQERGFRGARHGYVLVPDQPTVEYVDLVWVDKDTLDPLLPPSPAWVAALAAEVAARAAGDSTNAATAAAAQSTADAAVTGLGTKVNTSTYTAGLALKADVTALTAETNARVATDALKQDTATLADDTAPHVSDGSALDVAVAAKIVGLPASGDTTGVLDRVAINASLALFSQVRLRPGLTYYVDQAIQPTGAVRIEINGATLMLANGANDDVIRTSNFEARTGSAMSAHSDDANRLLISGPGIIDGNRTNQTTPATTIAAGSEGAALAQSTINVASTSGFPSSGSFTVYVGIAPNDPTQGNGVQTILYTGKTSTSFTGCTGGTGTLRTGDPVNGRGYGVRLFQRDFAVGGEGILEIRNCVADSWFTEWIEGTVATKSDGAMESYFGNLKLYGSGRNGMTFMGPHDSHIASVVAFGNGVSGLCNMRGALYIQQYHGWGTPQRYSMDLYSETHVVGGAWEVTNATGAIGVRIRAVRATLHGRVFAPPGTQPTSPLGGQIGVFARTGPDCDIDLQILDCWGGAFIMFTDGGVGRIRLVASQGKGAAIARVVNVVTSGSNGVNVNTFAGAGVINVLDASVFSSSGSAMVGTALGAQLVTFTGKTSTTLTGCTAVGSAAGVIYTGALVTQVNTISGGAANDASGVADTTAIDITTGGGTTARNHDTSLLGRRSSGTITPSATINTLGTAFTLTGRGGRALNLKAAAITAATSVGSETITFQITVTYADGTTTTFPMTTTITASGQTIFWGSGDLWFAHPSDKHVASIAIACKSSIASSTASITAGLTG